MCLWDARGYWWISIPELSKARQITSCGTLSRGKEEQCFGDRASEDDVAAHIEVIVSQLPANHPEIEGDQTEHREWSAALTVLGFIKNEWPEYRDKVPVTVMHFYQICGELSKLNGMVIRVSRIVI